MKLNSKGSYKCTIELGLENSGIPPNFFSVYNFKLIRITIMYLERVGPPSPKRIFFSFFFIQYNSGHVVIWLRCDY